MATRQSRISTTTRAVLAMAAGWIAAAPLSAAPTSPADASLAAVTACLDVKDSAARLTCYDTSAGKLRAAVQTGNVTVVDREEVSRTRRALFGFPIPEGGLLGHRADEKKPEFTEINGKITQCHETADSRWRLVLDDGSVWATDETPNIDPRSGDSIRVRHAAMGSFFGNINGARAVRMHRVG